MNNEQPIYVVSIKQVTEVEGESSPPQFEDLQIFADPFLVDFLLAVSRRNHRHGVKAFASPHEGYGIIAEEVFELIKAIRNNHSEGRSSEAMDVAVAAYHLYKSEKLGYTRIEPEQEPDILFQLVMLQTKGTKEFKLASKVIKEASKYCDNSLKF
ncbi:MAG: hypothetical protein LCH52_08405 [Bacteroidetes bacterium]|nr:hypothetical protein [Bacteroidota bacterium]